VKVGADNKKELIAAIVLAIAAVFSVWYWLSSSGTTSATSSPGPAAQRVARVPATAATKPPVNPDTIDPTIRLDVLRAAQNVTYSGRGRDIFRETVDIPKPVQPPIAQKPAGPPPPVCPGDPRCPPPPINLRFYGFASKPGEPKKIFLQQGDDIFIAGEGDVVDRRYKVLHIGVNSVDIQDLLNNNTQTIPLTQG
jgi:hypothetical protein